MIGRVLPCIRKKNKIKYAVDEVQVPDQCKTLWEGVQRAMASNGRIATVRVAEGDYELNESMVIVNVGKIRIMGAGRGKTCFHRNDNLAKIQISDGAQDVAIEDASIHGTGAGDGIVVLGGSSLRLQNVEISHVGGFGVHVSNASECEIIQCSISHCGCPGVWAEGEGTRCKVRDTTIHHNSSDGCFAIHGAECVLNGATRVHHNDGYGIGVEEEGKIYVRTDEKLGFAIENNTAKSQRKESGGGKIVVEDPR